MSAFDRLSADTFRFLTDLERHNDRDWFQANRDRYDAAHAGMQTFAEALIARMRKHDRIATANAKECLTRVFADQRFHKDRPPYKPRFGGRLARVKPELRGGYFFHFQPGGRSHLTCGFFGPEPDDLRRIRMDILYDHPTWQRLLKAKAVRTNFGGLAGEQVRTVPRGFPKDHPGIELIRHTQFLLRHPLSDADVLAPDLVGRVDAVFRSVRPFFDHLSAVLTTDANGDPLPRPKR